MIDVVDVGDRLDRHVILDGPAIGSLDRDRPFSRFGAHQDDLAGCVVYHQRVRICDHADSWSLAGGHIVDYVTLARIQGESHGRAFVGEQQAGPKQEHADNCD